MRIQRIKLKNWRNFPDLDMPFLGRTFVIGPNASGKSNLLGFFRFLRDIAREQGGGLQQAFKDRGGLSKVRCFAARANPLIEMEVQLGEWDSEVPKYVYRLGITQETRGARRPVVKYEEVLADGKQVLLRPDDDDKSDPERLTETHLEQTSANKEFREIASFFNDICYLHIVPQMIRSQDTGGLSHGSDDPFGKAFLGRVARTAEKIRKGRLTRIERALKIIAPQLAELAFEKDQSGQPHLVARYEHWRPAAGKQNEVQFSDGTLRAIGLLWMLQEGTSMLLIEEPELSLNSEIVKQLPGIMARVMRKNKRQLLISTHSFELLADPGIALEETVLLKPEKEGSVAVTASDDQSSIEMSRQGMSVAEIVLPMAAPRDAVQLSLRFDSNGD